MTAVRWFTLYTRTKVYRIVNKNASGVGPVGVLLLCIVIYNDKTLKYRTSLGCLVVLVMQRVRVTTLRRSLLLVEASEPIGPNHRCIWHAPPRPRGAVTPATQRGGAGGGAGGGGGSSSGGRCTLANCDILASCELSRHLLLEAVSLRGIAAEGPRA